MRTAALGRKRSYIEGHVALAPDFFRILCSSPVVIGLIERLLRRFLGVGNGKATPANVVISRFYTA